MEQGAMGLLAKTKTTLEMIKWEHSIFALPFALTATLLAARGMPAWRTLCLDPGGHGHGALLRHGLQPLGRRRSRRRQSAHQHPRHSRRPALAPVCPRLHRAHGARLCLLAAAELNRLTLYLSPLVLLVLLGYSYMKRVTRWSHLVLGLALGLAPSAAWIAVRGSLDPRILVLTAAVTLWVGGFDVLYACQDFDHDRAAGLHSLPQAVGIPAAFWAARVMHLAMLGLLVWFGLLFHFRPRRLARHRRGGLLLAYEHSLVSPRDLRRLNAAFFTMNGVIAMVFLALCGRRSLAAEIISMSSVGIPNESAVKLWYGARKHCASDASTMPDTEHCNRRSKAPE